MFDSRFITAIILNVQFYDENKKTQNTKQNLKKKQKYNKTN